MTSTAAFFARLLGLLTAAVATLAMAVGILGLPPAQTGMSDAGLQVATSPVSDH